MIRWYLYPFALIYGIITGIRNILYNVNILSSTHFNIPVIAVGNLSMGGTGKSPHSIYLAGTLSKQFSVGVLSRGYGRKTSGFQVVNYHSRYDEVGDEPLQIFERFRNKIIVAVSENRVKGIQKLQEEYHTNLIILDDAFQHRSVSPQYNILLTAYDHLYVHDYVVPMGYLREFRWGAHRADCIVVTKCPHSISDSEKQQIIKKIHPKSHQKVFFSTIKYHNELIGRNHTIDTMEWKNYEALIVTGIADNQLFVDHLSDVFSKVECISFKDHHNFTPKDIQTIKDKFLELKGDRIIVTTEKDYMRLKSFQSIVDNLFYLPIDVHIFEEEEFLTNLTKYVTTN